MKDWTGNTKSVYAILAASNHAIDKDREQHDYYATSPEAIDILLDEGNAKLSHIVWEPFCGEGHLSKRLEERGFKVYSSDLIDRGYGQGGKDFLSITKSNVWKHDIISNPPL